MACAFYRKTGLPCYLQQPVPFEAFLMAPKIIKHANAKKIAKLSAIGKRSKAAAKSNRRPATHKTVPIQFGLSAMQSSFLLFCSQHTRQRLCINAQAAVMFYFNPIY